MVRRKETMVDRWDDRRNGNQTSVARFHASASCKYCRRSLKFVFELCAGHEPVMCRLCARIVHECIHKSQSCLGPKPERQTVAVVMVVVGMVAVVLKVVWEEGIDVPHGFLSSISYATTITTTPPPPPPPCEWFSRTYWF